MMKLISANCGGQHLLIVSSIRSLIIYYKQSYVLVFISDKIIIPF